MSFSLPTFVFNVGFTLSRREFGKRASSCHVNENNAGTKLPLLTTTGELTAYLAHCMMLDDGIQGKKPDDQKKQAISYLQWQDPSPEDYSPQNNVPSRNCLTFLSLGIMGSCTSWYFHPSLFCELCSYQGIRLEQASRSLSRPWCSEAYTLHHPDRIEIFPFEDRVHKPSTDILNN